MSYRFETDIARHVWETRYRWCGLDGPVDGVIEDTWRRVARALAAAEPPARRHQWEEAFYAALADFRFLPGGRILAGAGTGRAVTLLNCFVMGTIEDSVDGIFAALREGALTMQAGGGVGYDFSTLRPRGSRARSTGNVASGPVSFMRIWDVTCATMLSTGARRGAMMATLRCDHPDVEDFIDAKQTPATLSHFNCSVLISDSFMEAVTRDADWPLVFPADALAADGGTGATVERDWPGREGPVPCRVVRRVSARELWRRLMRATYDHAEPGVLFIDRINAADNLRGLERIHATNPCGEVPLPPYGACDLGSVNLTRFVVDPFGPGAALDLEAIAAIVPLAVRMLDNVIDVSLFPLAAQAEQARATRRIGLGFTGLADALAMLGLHYGDEPARALAGRIMRTIRDAAYGASADIAREKGPFPRFDADRFLAAPGPATLPAHLRDAIARHGVRNSHLTAVAPAGTISLLAENVSSGIEPAFALRYRRQVRTARGDTRSFELENFALRRWRTRHGDAVPPESLVTATELPARTHLAMQAAVQPWVDHAISKTVNVPEALPFDAFEALYAEAYALGLKGCTTYRPNPVTGAVLSSAPAAATAVPSCGADRECD